MSNPFRIDRVGVIGAGAIGTVLAAVLGGVVPPVVVCRNPRRAAQLFAHGAECRGVLESASRPIIVRTVEDLGAIGGVGAVFVTTKTTAIDGIASDLAPLCNRADGPIVVSCQNGIDPGRRLSELLPHGRVARMVLNLGASCDPSTGAASVTLNAAPHTIGSPDARLGEVCGRLAALLSEGGLETVADADIEARVWAKSLMNAAVNPVAALCNMSVGQIMSSPARPIVDRLLREGIEVAGAEGIDLGAGYLEHAAATLSRAAGHTPSMVEDVRSGRESEIGQLNRPIIDRGRLRGVPTPTHEVVDSLIEALDWAVSGRGSGGFGPAAR